MNPLIYSEMQPTRDYLQDIAKILGKVQQVFIAPAPHDWHKGLEITSTGLTTQDLGGGRRLLLDFMKVELSMDTFTMQLQGMDSGKVFDTLATWAKRSGSETAVEKPELLASSADYDAHQAAEILAALLATRDALKEFSGNIKGGTLSPLLLYPHHFDASLVWFPKDDDEQLGFGFSTGDKDINEAYYYVTEWPEQPDFTQTKLVPPAYWQRQGFSGAILPYNDIVLATNPKQLVLEFLSSFINR